MHKTEIRIAISNMKLQTRFVYCLDKIAMFMTTWALKSLIDEQNIEEQYGAYIVLLILGLGLIATSFHLQYLKDQEVIKVLQDKLDSYN